jgi:type III restriction enzyme
MLSYLRDKDGNAFVASWLSRRDGLHRIIPNVCLKVPTGGGKTLLAACTLERIQTDYFKRQTGFVLWGGAVRRHLPPDLETACRPRASLLADP